MSRRFAARLPGLEDKEIRDCRVPVSVLEAPELLRVQPDHVGFLRLELDLHNACLIVFNIPRIPDVFTILSFSINSILQSIYAILPSKINVLSTFSCFS